MTRFDLQSHSTVSDGALPPAEVVARAAAAGIELFALSDHDSVDGVETAIATGRELGVAIVPAVELSTVEPEAEDLHLLGYDVDHTSPQLLETLKDMRADRNARGAWMAVALESCEFVLNRREIDARVAAGLPIGRPHLAEAVLSARANAGRLRDEGISDVGGLIENYLVRGAPAFVRRTRPSVAEAIDIVHAAGGVAIWAHPFWDIADPDEVLATLDRFRAVGLDGVEAFYVTHDEEQTRLLAGYAAEHGLLSTGSADFHGPEHTRFHTIGAFSTHDLQPALGSLTRRLP